MGAGINNGTGGVDIQWHNKR